MGSRLMWVRVFMDWLVREVNEKVLEQVVARHSAEGRGEGVKEMNHLFADNMTMVSLTAILRTA